MSANQNSSEQTKSFSKKNWDKIVDDELGKDDDPDIIDLFKQIYNSSSDEVRRAMNKSYQESNGTVLSTNWQQVADKKVEPKPASSSSDNED